MKLLSPSLLSADFGNLQRDIEMLNNSCCDWLHVDVMDGIFVPNISFGQPVVKHIKKYARKPLDVHLMIMDPGRYINDFKEAGADILTVHYEACTHLDRTLHAIRDAGMKCGVVLNPASPVAAIEDAVHICDMVLLMSVNPGNMQNAAKLYELGADVLVAGNAVFKSDNPLATIEQLKQ